MIDEAQFLVKAGDGGHGKVSFRHEKYVPKGGPDGGDGGRGGSVYLETIAGLNTLRFFAGKDRFEARNGGAGERMKRTGANAEDLTIPVPVGTVVSSDGQLLADLTSPGQRFLLARGGQGGKGNWYFRSPTNTTPREVEPGEPGEIRSIQLELKILAQVGLVGFPNAGKSTLLSVLTRAKPQIANYPFTTLSPNLGVMVGSGNRELVIADLPGLIEGASHGKGLGIKFLKHVERCRLLIFVLAPQDDWLLLNPGPLAQNLLEQRKKLRTELLNFNKDLDKFNRLTIINKIDLLTEKQLACAKLVSSSLGEEVLLVSAATDTGLPALSEKIFTLSSKEVSL